MKGDEQVLSERDFHILWNSDILNAFYQKTNILIDDYEMSIVENISNLFFLKRILESVSFINYKLFKLSKRILLLVNLAIERKSGMIFFF